MRARLQHAVARCPPVAALQRLSARRPFLTAWAFLAGGMALAVLVFGRDVGLSATQHALLAVLCAPLAWLCTWIVFQESEDASDGAG